MEASLETVAGKGAKKILIYGSYGYTGRLIVAEGIRRGLPMLLSGRDPVKLRAQAEEVQLPWRAFSLENAPAMQETLQECAAVLHCAGPYIHTWRAMAEACLLHGVHYFDITGEIAVFEGLHGLHERALARGIQVLPGVGFDVVPTDCLAARLHARMPDATRLDLAIMSVGGGSSHGTAMTMVESLGQPSLARRGGKIVERPMGGDRVQADFGRGPKWAVGIPWGDVSTAFYSTGIPDITTYIALSGSAARFLGLSNAIGWLLRTEWVKNLARARISKGAAGPDAAARAKSIALAWGRVENAQGEILTDVVRVANGYDFTAQSAVHVALLLLAGNFKPGFQTPSSAYGAGLVDAVNAAAVSAS